MPTASFRVSTHSRQSLAQDISIVERLAIKARLNIRIGCARLRLIMCEHAVLEIAFVAHGA